MMSTIEADTTPQDFIGDIEDLAEDNQDFRCVLYTGRHLQLVLMSLQPGEDIGSEVHPDHDQFFRVEAGEGQVDIEGGLTPIKDNDAVLVPAGLRHNIINTGRKPLKLYTLYGPAHHPDGTVHRTKLDAASAK